MKIIPVIDLMHGHVVHARNGRREQYRPIHSPLCRGSEPVTVVGGLLRVHPFNTFYVADLDALMGREPQSEALHRLALAFPDLRFWVDRGWPACGNGGFSWAGENFTTVIGSESLDDARLPRLTEATKPFVLSLDFRNGRLLGPISLLAQPALWPETIIVMSLSHVGGDAGPDFERLGEFRQRHPERHCVAAGGVRDARDLASLNDMGIAAALMASALHSGTIDSASLVRYG
jgi:phosphoribosylformimino-5-aminoimidazole carboxamide ribotide isomerase